MKRKIKEDLKLARQKIIHQIKYCQVPSNLLEEAMYRFKSGMTSRDIVRPKHWNKYENAPHIGRIVPSKRPVTISIEQSQRMASLHEKERAQKEEDSKLINYLTTIKGT